jgi:hypothetical protein
MTKSNKKKEIRNVRIGFNEPYKINKNDIPFLRKILEVMEKAS